MTEDVSPDGKTRMSCLLKLDKFSDIPLQLQVITALQDTQIELTSHTGVLVLLVSSDEEKK